MNKSFVLENNRIQIGTQEIYLTPLEATIFQAVYAAGEKGITKEELNRLLWESTKRASKSLNVHVFNLRDKIEPIGASIRFIRPNVFVFVSGEIKETTQVAETQAISSQS